MLNPKVKAVATAVEKRFEEIVGQAAAKEQLFDILCAAAVDGYVPPMMLISPKGWGKSLMMEAIRDMMRDTLSIKTLFATRGDGLGTRAEFMEEIYIPKMNGKKAAVIADEIHEAHKSTQMMIRTLLEPRADRRARIVDYNGSEAVFDPFINTFVIATNKIDLIDEALASRFERIDLAPYTTDELAEILFRGVKADGIAFHDDTLYTLAECGRGSARDIVQWIDAIRRRVNVQGKNSINKEDCAAVIRSRKCYPKGVTALELTTILLLEKRGPMQLKELAAANMCSRDEQDANESYLRKMGFIVADGKRKISTLGREYLAELRAAKYIPEIPCSVE